MVTAPAFFSLPNSSPMISKCFFSIVTLCKKYSLVKRHYRFGKGEIRKVTRDRLKIKKQKNS